MVGLQSGNSPLKFGKGGGGVKKSCRQTTLFVWYHQESNRGHKDFQSFALPTELWHLMLVRSGNISFAVAKVVKLLDSASLMEIKNTDKKLVG